MFSRFKYTNLHPRRFYFPFTHFSCIYFEKSVLIDFSFSLKGRGTVATGRIEQGVIKVGEEVEILGLRDVSVHE